MAIAGYVEVSAEVLEIARDNAFAMGESTVCINVEFTHSNLDPDLVDRAETEFRDLLLQAKRMGICDLMLSE